MFEYGPWTLQLPCMELTHRCDAGKRNHCTSHAGTALEHCAHAQLYMVRCSLAAHNRINSWTCESRNSMLALDDLLGCAYCTPPFARAQALSTILLEAPSDPDRPCICHLALKQARPRPHVAC